MILPVRSRWVLLFTYESGIERISAAGHKLYDRQLAHMLRMHRIVWIWIFFGFITFFPPLLLPAVSPLYSVYKTGVIRLNPAVDFGQNTDWDEVFYNTFSDVTVASDGSIFASSSRQHKVFKFSPGGTVIESFGKLGQGPGDLTYPDEISILDDDILVVMENPQVSRISLFDLEGHFIKILKPRMAPYSAVSLREGKIAYKGVSTLSENALEWIETERVLIKDIHSGKEKIVAEFKETVNFIKKGGRTWGLKRFQEGRCFIASTAEGNLLVADNENPEIHIVNPDGIQQETLKLNIAPVPYTRNYLKRFRDYKIKALEDDSSLSREKRQFQIKQVRDAPYEIWINHAFPLYREILTDSEGNILVFRRTDCVEDCPVVMTVFSPEGEFICETLLDTGEYRLNIDPRRKHMVFTSKGLYFLVEDVSASNYVLKLIKVNTSH